MLTSLFRCIKSRFQSLVYEDKDTACMVNMVAVSGIFPIQEPLMHPSVHFIELLWLELAQKFCLAGGSTCSALYQPSTCSATPWLNHMNSVNGGTKK